VCGAVATCVDVVCCCAPDAQVHALKRNFGPVPPATRRVCLPKADGLDKIDRAAFVACQPNPVTYKDFYVLKSRFADHGIPL
jgi:hypothetical protein